MKIHCHHRVWGLAVAMSLMPLVAASHEIGVSGQAMSRALAIPNLQLLTPPQDIHSHEFASSNTPTRMVRKC